MKKIFKLLSLLSVLLIVSACSSNQAASEEPRAFSVGVVSDLNTEIWESVAPRLKEEKNIDLEVVQFSDFVQPNVAVADGEIDANLFQYPTTIAEFNEGTDSDLVPAAYMFVVPIGIWAADGIDSLEEVPEGAQVAVVNDPINIGNALVQMENAGLIELADDAAVNPTIEDISSNPLNLEVVPLQGSQVARALGDVELSITATSMALDADLEPEEAIYMEDPASVDNAFKLVMAVQSKRVDDPLIQDVIEVYQSEETAEAAAEISENAYFPAWSEDDAPLEDFEEFQS